MGHALAVGVVGVAAEGPHHEPIAGDSEPVELLVFVAEGDPVELAPEVTERSPAGAVVRRLEDLHPAVVAYRHPHPSARSVGPHPRLGGDGARGSFGSPDEAHREAGGAGGAAFALARVFVGLAGLAPHAPHVHQPLAREPQLVAVAGRSDAALPVGGPSARHVAVGPHVGWGGRRVPRGPGVALEAKPPAEQNAVVVALEPTEPRARERPERGPVVARDEVLVWRPEHHDGAGAIARDLARSNARREGHGHEVGVGPLAERIRGASEYAIWSDGEERLPTQRVGDGTSGLAARLLGTKSLGVLRGTRERERAFRVLRAREPAEWLGRGPERAVGAHPENSCSLEPEVVERHHGEELRLGAVPLRVGHPALGALAEPDDPLVGQAARQHGRSGARRHEPPGRGSHRGGRGRGGRRRRRRCRDAAGRGRRARAVGSQGQEPQNPDPEQRPTTTHGATVHHDRARAKFGGRPKPGACTSSPRRGRPRPRAAGLGAARDGRDGHMTPFPRLAQLTALEVSPASWDVGTALARAFVHWAADAGFREPDGLRVLLAEHDAALEARRAWFEDGSSDERYSLSGYWGQDRWVELCSFRSGVAFLVALGAPWWASALGVRAWDESVAWHRGRAGPASERALPEGVPPSHAWWFADGGPFDDDEP